MSRSSAAYVTSFDARARTSGAGRAVRFAGKSLVFGVSAVVAVGVMGFAVTLAAAWLTGRATNTQLYSAAPMGPGALALSNGEPRRAWAGTTFETKWAGRTSTDAAEPAPSVQVADATPAPAPAPVIPLPPRRVAEHVKRVPLPTARPNSPLVQVAQAPAPVEVAQVYAEPIGPPVPKVVAQAAAPSPPQGPPKPAQQIAMASPPSTKPAQPQNKPAMPDPDSRTAVYDISARTVYLPNGQRLEAHSGLGDKLDDPAYVRVRMRGPTPPNVYELTLREQLFHGVRAIRLNPVDEDKMHGRAGMLAHTYMLGPNGDSNGCVSFKDYNKFLEAFLRGEVDRLVVVPAGGTQLALAARARRGHVGRYADASPPPAAPSDRTW